MNTLIVYSLLSLQKQVSSVQWASFNDHGKILSSKKEEDKQVSANKFINSRHVSSKVQSRFSHARSIDQFYANREHKAPREKENFENAALFSTVRPTFHTNPSRKRSFWKCSSNKEEFENAGFAFLKTELYENDAFSINPSIP